MGKKGFLTILLIAALFGCEYLLNDYSIAEPVEICDDGIDNDGDDDTDCWDTDCGFEGPVELTCNDNRDNDCDGQWDSADSDCFGLVEICGDGIDNDGDTLVDCEDEDDCLDQPAGGCTYSCQHMQCNCDLLYEDDFSSASSGWYEEHEEGFSVYYTSGEYAIEVKNPEWMSWSFLPPERIFDDFTVECDVKLVSTSELHWAGLMWRHVTDQDTYLLRIFGSGDYLVQKRVDGTWTTIVELQGSSYINGSGSWNRIKVTGIGSQFSGCVNDYLLFSFEDSTYSEGDFALAAGTWGDPIAEAHFDNIKVYQE